MKLRIVAIAFTILVFQFCLVVSLSAMDFSTHPNNKSENLLAILATGEMKLGDVDKLALFISRQQKRKNTAVYLGSNGGDLYEGMRMGLYFKTNGIKTTLEGNMVCASACALAFLGGTDSKGNSWRSSSTNAKLGFHAFRAASDESVSSDKVQSVVADILIYGKRVDAPVELLIVNFMTPSSEITWVPNEIICQLGIKLWNVQTSKFECN